MIGSQSSGGGSVQSADLLREELKELHRGRGIRRNDVRSWLGPQLQKILGITATTSDEDARTALVALIDDHTRHFPRDLRYLFLVSTGISTDERYLEQRLEVAAKKLDRSVRVLRRHLRDAEEKLADSLAQTYGSSTGPFDDHGWQWETQDFSLVLRDDAKLTVTRTLRALADHQKYVHESFIIPGALEPGAEPTFAALRGFTIVDVDHPSPTRWEVTFQLPQKFCRGQVLEVKFLVVIPNPRAINPFLVVAPLRSCRHICVTVDFGTPSIASTTWVINDAYPIGIEEYIPASVENPNLTPVIVGEFSAPHIGLAYGVGWTWAE